MTVVVLVVPASARAGTAWVAEDGDDAGRYVTLRYAAAPGEVNTARLMVRAGKFRLSDGVAVVAGEGCSADGLNRVSCPIADPGPSVAYGALLDVGDGDDVVTVDGDPALRYNAYPIVLGGPGNDRLIGASGVMLRGGEGDDALTGSRQSDTLWGGGGRDVLDGGVGDDLLSGDQDDPGVEGEPALLPASDRLEGGPGGDFVSYSERTRTVAVNLAAGIGGEPGEADVLVGIEHAYGGHADDQLRGDARDNRLTGYDGRDELFGGDGDDQLEGDGLAGRYANRMFADAGDDHLSGGGAVSCGGGVDRVGIVDRRRPQPNSCELIDIDGGQGDLALSAHPSGVTRSAVILLVVARCGSGPCVPRRTTVTMHASRSVLHATVAAGRVRVPRLPSGERWSRRIMVRFREGGRTRARRRGALTVRARSKYIVAGGDGGVDQARFVIRLRGAARG